MYNGKFKQCLEVIVDAHDHQACLAVAKVVKKQCDAWYFNVRYDEHKSARKGPVLKRDLMIYQTAYAGDIVIFKEAVRRICQHFDIFLDGVDVKFTDRGSEPVNSLREGGAI